MTREEYKVQLKAYFLFNDYEIPDWANWITIDGDGELSIFENKPMFEKSPCTGIKYTNNERWFNGVSSSVDNRNNSRIIFGGFVEFYFISEKSLISIKELFT